jgi:toxin ParE1/3/4
MVRHNRNIRFSASARQDFVAILRYTLATWGEAQMLRYRETLETGLDNLADNPQLGRLRQELSQEYRSIRIAAHVMIYRLDGETIYIVRILHNRMDPATQLAE